MKNIIAVDIGGTNSRFAHFRIADSGELSYVDAIWLSTQDASSLENLIETAWQKYPLAAQTSWDAMILAVPGAVRDGTYAELANVPWVVDVSGLRARTPHTRTFLINDFVAQAFACPLKDYLKIHILRAGSAQSGANIAIIGAGTGLGHCALAPTGQGTFLPLPSEAGHAAFSFYGKAETEYRDWLLDRTGAQYLHGDMVVSGPGLVHLHSFLTGHNLTPAEVVAEIGPDSQTTVLFARFYARAARNYALNVLALGGFYISGGVAMKNPFLVDNEYFLKEFSDSPHYGPVLGHIPLTLLLSEDCGLWGAAHYGAINLEIK